MKRGAIWGFLILPVLALLLIRLFTTDYYISGVYKLLFLTPFLFRFIEKRKAFEWFDIKKFKKNLGKTCLLAGILFVIFVGLYTLVLRHFIDFGMLMSGITDKLNIGLIGIIFIGIYVIFINSFLEEFFWRGFIFKELLKYENAWIASIASAIGYTSYHLILAQRLFSVPMMIVMGAGLFIFGIILNNHLQKTDLFSCWLVHAVQDLVIIAIGFRLFGII